MTAADLSPPEHETSATGTRRKCEDLLDLRISALRKGRLLAPGRRGELTWNVGGRPSRFWARPPDIARATKAVARLQPGAAGASQPRNSEAIFLLQKSFPPDPLPPSKALPKGCNSA